MSRTVEPNKYLKLKIHHLSEYVINLWAVNGKPYCLDVELITENYSDTSDNKKMKVRHVDLISIGDDPMSPYSPFSYTRTITYITPNWEHKDVNRYPYERELFEFYFNAFTDNIDAILLINKKIKETKVRRKDMGRIDYETKQQFKRDIKNLELNRSHYKTNIKSLLNSIYNHLPAVSNSIPVELVCPATDI